MKARAISRVSSFVNLGESRPCAFGCTLWAYVLYAVFLTLTKYCCAAFACVEIEPDVHVLAADPDVQCYVGDHIAIMFFGAVGFVVYVFGCAAMVQNPTGYRPERRERHRFPFATCVVLRNLNRDRSHETDEQLDRHGHLYDRFDASAARGVDARYAWGMPRSFLPICSWAASVFRKLHRRRGYSQVQPSASS